MALPGDGDPQAIVSAKRSEWNKNAEKSKSVTITHAGSRTYVNILSDTWLIIICKIHFLMNLPRLSLTYPGLYWTYHGLYRTYPRLSWTYPRFIPDYPRLIPDYPRLP